MHATVATTGRNNLATATAPRKISPNFGANGGVNMKHCAAEPDPGQLLNEWLGELDNLQKVKIDYLLYV